MTEGKKCAVILDRLSSVGVKETRRAAVKKRLPSAPRIRELTEKILAIMLFDLSDERRRPAFVLKKRTKRIFALMEGQIKKAMNLSRRSARGLAWSIMSVVPDIKAALIKDSEAICSADPAASSAEEVIICYPGFYATAVYRLAHELYLKKIPYIPRIMTEFAHEKTGIDIHPGATIGEGFCIDHGTGVVIGETAVIGNNVRIYQGVTLGAKSLEQKGEGGSLRGVKRHPEIGNNCIIYANATILGGDTVIGDGCVIGGNVWLTHSISSGQRVYYKDKNGLSD